MTDDTRPSGEETPVGEGPVGEQVGSGEGLGDAGAGEESTREVGIGPAVERGPAETSSEGEPVRDNPRVALEDEDQARSTDEL